MRGEGRRQDKKRQKKGTRERVEVTDQMGKPTKQPTNLEKIYAQLASFHILYRVNFAAIAGAGVLLRAYFEQSCLGDQLHEYDCPCFCLWTFWIVNNAIV